MADRIRRGVRRQISDATEDSSEDVESESEEDYDPRKSDSLRRAGNNEYVSKFLSAVTLSLDYELCSCAAIQHCHETFITRVQISAEA